MKTGPTGTPTFEYGKFGVPTSVGANDPNTNQPTTLGPADAGSSYNVLTGVVRIVLSKDKLRAFDGGAGKYLPGSDLAATTPRVFFNRAGGGLRLQSTSTDFSGEGTYTLVGNAFCAPVADLVRAVSRKTHGPAGIFDIDLPITGTRGIECRSGANGNHTVVFTFANPLTSVGGATVSSGTGSVSSSAIDSSDPRNYIVNLTGVTNAQTITVILDSVNDSAGNSSASVSVPMGMLLGDVNSSRNVESGDVFLTRERNGRPISGGNFQSDLNASGRIDSGDVFIVRRQNPSGLP